jgi:hypothetical protein
MRRPVTWLCLSIALAGPLASEARAACGLALSLAEIGQNLYESAEEDAAEDYDGHEFMAITANAQAGIAVFAELPSPLDILTLVPRLELPPSAFHAVRHRHGLWQWPPATAQERHALLQTLLL